MLKLGTTVKVRSVQLEISYFLWLYL